MTLSPGGELHIKFPLTLDPDTVTVVTLEDREASEQARDEAVAARDTAVAVTEVFTAPADTVIAGLVCDSNSELSVAISAKIASEIPEQPLTGGAGSELGYAQSATVFSNATTSPVDVPGLTTTFVATDGPVEIRFDGDFTHTVAGGIVVLYIVLDGAIICRPNGAAQAANTWQTVSRRIRVNGLTPGRAYTAKIQIAAIGGTGRVQGDAGNPMSISVVTL